MLDKTIKGIPFYQENRFYTKIRRVFYINGHVENDNIIVCEPRHSLDTERCPLANYKIDWSNISKKGQALESSKPGHWVSSKEIEYLINILLDKKRSSSSFLPENTKIFCLEGDIQDLFNLEDNLKQTAIEFKDNAYEGTTIFILYYPQHWVTCVVDKKKNERPRFIFADSLNIDRTKSDQAFQLIGALSNFNFVQDKFIPLNLLVENEKISELESTIELLNSNLKDLRGLWLYGPAKTGKSSLANSLSKLTNWPLKNINTPKHNISKSISESDRIKDKNIKEIVQFYSNFIGELLNEINQENSPTILFIRHIDKIKDLYKKQIFKLFAKMLEDNKKNNRLFIMFSSNTNPEELAQYYDFSDLVDYMKIDSPDYNKRLKIINYYIQNLLYKNILIKVNKNKRTFSLEEKFIRESHKEILATATRDFSCQDIADMMQKIETAIKKDLKNYGKNSIFYRIFHCIDSRNRSTSTTIKILTLGAIGFSIYNFKPSINRVIGSLLVLTGIAYHQSSDLWSINEYEKYLQAYYEIQKYQVENRKKIKIAKNKMQQLTKAKGTNQKKSLIVESKDAYRQGIIDWARTNATSHMDKLVNFTADFVINVTKAFYNIIKNYNNQNPGVAIPVIQTQNNAYNIVAAQEDRSQ
ncbi:AAA family ATPase [Candidatus Babela massiliensis]|uniref:ATPase of the AAA+ class n=1 Tax=Candidatus Babela massiliensis TaxID=673862 RepID=V6DGM1_9BACT|nr:AAA family ATPase [Candidatus Babela massiliensis]CDK30715.1 ATPase of the AAA+ class [Candidatus Babela massiliensis]